MNCETTCPSGVRYGRLVDIGRAVVDEHVPRAPADARRRAFLRFVLTRRWIFDPAVRLGRLFRSVLPLRLKSKLPAARAAGTAPQRRHPRKVLLLNGCVQPALMPAIDAATARVLDALAIEAIVEPRSGCCGALDYHLTAIEAAKAAARRNIDAWWPHIVRGTEAIVINASGCGAMVKDYEHLLHDEPAYAVKALRVVGLTLDLAELLAPMQQALSAKCSNPDTQAAPHRIAFHPPCSLQHTQKIRGAVEGILTGLGAELVPVGDAHLCCGSAGSYSLLQPELSRQLRARKLENLEHGKPQMILSANIGCLAHLETGTGIPMRHWIEWVDGLLDR
jgi:glycolate oxidase iron-sulfur subunit